MCAGSVRENSVCGGGRECLYLQTLQVVETLLGFLGGRAGVSGPPKVHCEVWMVSTCHALLKFSVQ